MLGWFRRISNVVPRALLRSPLHGLLSRGVLLITVTGRRSGRAITTPVHYVQRGDAVYITSRRGRRWWRNVQPPARVTLRLRGHSRRGLGGVLEDEAGRAEARAAFTGSVLAHVLDRPDLVIVRVRLDG